MLPSSDELAARPAAAPLWVALLDAATVLLLVVTVAVLVGGGFRISTDILRLSVTQAWIPLLLAVAIALIRRALWRRPSLGEHVGAAARQLWRAESFHVALGPFLATRLSVFLAGLLAVYTIGVPATAPPLRLSDSLLVNLPVRWDAGWYLSVARNGYMWTPRDAEMSRQQNIAFFPAYPMAMRYIGRLFGGGGLAYLYGGVAISLVAFLWALALLYQLARDELGDRAAAAGSVMLLASYPFSVFYGGVYTESVFLLGVLGAVLSFTRQRWAAAILWGLLVGLTRPNGCFVSVTLAALALGWQRSRPASPTRWSPWQLAAIGAPVAGAAIYCLFMWQFTGNPFQWSLQHEAWGRTYKGLAPFAEAAGFAAEHGVESYVQTLPYDFMNAVAVVAALALVVPVGLRLGWAYAIFIVSNLVPPLLVGGLTSTGRFTSTMFPLFLWLGATTRRATPTVVLAFAILQGLVAVLFYTWHPVF